MALKEYRWRGFTWQFAEGEQPEDAVPVEKAAKPAADKAAKPAANKARTSRTKKARTSRTKKEA